MFDHLLESSHRDDSNKWSNIGFGQEIKEKASKFILRILSGALVTYLCTAAIEAGIKDKLFLPGSVGSEDVLGILHWVHEDDHLWRQYIIMKQHG